MSPEERGRAELSAWGRLDLDEIMSHFSADASGTTTTARHYDAEIAREHIAGELATIDCIA